MKKLCFIALLSTIIITTGCQSQQIDDEIQVQESIKTFEDRPIYSELTTEIIDSISDDELLPNIYDNIFEKIKDDFDNDMEIISKLSKERQAIYFIWIVDGEVNNGGFNQFYFNSSKRVANQAVEAFELIGAHEQAQIMKQANVIYNSQQAEIEENQGDTLESFSKSYEDDPFDELDSQYYKSDEKYALYELEIDFIRQNKEKFIDETTTDPITYKDFPRSGTLFRGYYFDIKYPREFIAKPTEPTVDYNNKTFVQTDEAYFSSPDGTVEFFVYSPLWSGDPENYLTIAPTEEIVSDKTETGPALPNQLKDSERVIRWVTIKAKDESYYRSFVSIKEQVRADGHSELHHVFGIKYQDDEAYEKYKDAYTYFKNSLEQYAD